MAVTQNAAKDAVATVGFWAGDKHFFRRDQTLVDKNSDNFLTEFLLLLLVALSVLNLEFCALHEKVV